MLRISASSVTSSSPSPSLSSARSSSKTSSSESEPSICISSFRSNLPFPSVSLSASFLPARASACESRAFAAAARFGLGPNGSSSPPSHREFGLGNGFFGRGEASDGVDAETPSFSARAYQKRPG